MSTIPIVFVFDKNIILAAYIAIQSLIDTAYNATNYNIHIFHDGIHKKYLKEFEKITNNTHHKLYTHLIERERFKDAPKNKNGWTEMVYYRLLIPEILPQYDKVIYSDVDVLFKDDLSDLYNMDLENYELAALSTSINIDSDENRAIGKIYFPENKNKYQYNSGILVFNSKKMREEKTVDKFFETIEQFKDRLKFFDQDVINITCNRITQIDVRYNMFQPIYYNDDFTNTKEYHVLKSIYTKEELIKKKNSTKIIHYAGPKPWLAKNPPKEYEIYMKKVPKALNYYSRHDSAVKFLNYHPIIAKLYRNYIKQFIQIKK